MTNQNKKNEGKYIYLRHLDGQVNIHSILSCSDKSLNITTSHCQLYFSRIQKTTLSADTANSHNNKCPLLLYALKMSDK